MGHRGEAAGEALRPRRAAQARGGDADDRTGDGDAALGQDDRGGDDALDPQARQRQQVDQPQEESSDGHGPIVEMPNYRLVVGRVRLARRDERHQDLVDELHDQIVGDRVPGDQQPMPQHALAQFAGDLDGNVGAHVAALDAAGEQRGHLLFAPADDVVLKRRGQLGIVRGRSDGGRSTAALGR